MDEFNNTAKLVMFSSGIPTEAGGEEQEEGPDPFPPAAQDVCGDGIDQGHAGIEVLPYAILYSVQLTPIGLPHIRHVVQGRDDWTLCHAADGMAAKEIKSSK